VTRGDHSLSPAPGWYVGPDGRGGLRFWDGVGWTDDFDDAPLGGGDLFPLQDAPPGGGDLFPLPARRRHFWGPFLIAMWTLLLVAGLIAGAVIDPAPRGLSAAESTQQICATVQSNPKLPLEPPEQQRAKLNTLNQEMIRAPNSIVNGVYSVGSYAGNLWLFGTDRSPADRAAPGFMQSYEISYSQLQSKCGLQQLLPGPQYAAG
jgi:hypothetical protein